MQQEWRLSVPTKCTIFITDGVCLCFEDDMMHILIYNNQSDVWKLNLEQPTNSIQCDVTQYDAMGCNSGLCKQFDVHFTLFLTLLARKHPVAINQYITLQRALHILMTIIFYLERSLL